jgi:hypothetical protein
MDRLSDAQLRLLRRASVTGRCLVESQWQARSANVLEERGMGRVEWHLGARFFHVTDAGKSAALARNPASADLTVYTRRLRDEHGVLLKRAYVQPKRGRAVVDVLLPSGTRVRYFGKPDQTLADVFERILGIVAARDTEAG